MENYKLCVMLGDRELMIFDWDWRYKIETTDTGRLYILDEEGNVRTLIGIAEDIDYMWFSDKVSLH